MNTDQHRRYERRMVMWLGLTYMVIALVAGGLVLYCPLMIGWRPARWG